MNEKDPFGGVPGHVWVAERRLMSDGEYRQTIADWLTANDVDPGDVPMGSGASVADGKLTLLVYVRKPDGKLTEDPETPYKVLRRSITVPVKVKPNADVELWLTPKCPTCGR